MPFFNGIFKQSFKDWKGKINMKKNKIMFGSMVLLGSLLLTSCGPSGGDDDSYKVTGPYLTGKLAKTTYNAYLGSAPKTLNPSLSQSGEDVPHIANSSATLVLNDEFGILRHSLATSATRSDDYTTYSFTVRDDVPWVKYDGSIYSYKGKEQYVCADDFVTTAKIILDYNTQSQIYYMYTLFVSNAWEYYCYTMMMQFIAQQKPGYTNLKGNKAAQAAKLTELVKEYSGSDPEETILASDIDKIKNFERVGVKAEGNKITYTLKISAQFFPTVLTYCPYMPINSYFYNSDGGKANGYGTSIDKTLYCGPYRITKFSSNEVDYEKNDKYFDADKVHVNKVVYKVVDASTTSKDMREAFDRDDVDGFALSAKDDVGWNTYIKGPDGTGTIQDPYSDLVNSRELDDVDYTYHYSLDINRSTDKASYDYATYWNDLGIESDDDKVATIVNTNAALKIKEVRKLILNAFDISIYNSQFTNSDDPNQYQINTFTPRGYVYDENGTDYVDFYYSTYAEKKGLTGGKEEAKSLVGPQQISGVQYLTDDAENQEMLSKYSWLSLTTMRNEAISAIEQGAKDSDLNLTLPIVVDFFGSGGISADSLSMENKLVRSWNERANGCTLSEARSEATGLPLCGKSNLGEGHYPYFEMVHDKISNSANYETASNNGYYTVSPSWGWIGDYADPLTYMHTYVTNGEMCKMSGNTENFPSYSLVNGTLTKSSKHMLEDYNNLVNEASEIHNSNYERYTKFAEAEYMLLNELYLIKPSYMSTQGWSASISRAAGYENPNAAYGIADHSLVGIWVLKEVPTGAERKEARALQAQNKEAALAAVNNNTIEAIFA